MAGRFVPMSMPRRWITDLMRLCRDVPLVTFQRRMHLREVADFRNGVPWPVLFLKAYALLSGRRPELRRLFVPFPFARLYEHPESVAVLSVERELRGEPAVFFAPFRAPESQPLDSLVEHLRKYRTDDVERVGAFRRLIRLSRWPGPVRRLLWWWGLNTSADRRARIFGTFAVSVTASLGAWGVRLRSPTTATIHYGPTDEDGGIDVFLTFDHRVLDGAPVARAMAELEAILRGEIVTELRAMAERRTAA